MTRPLPKYAMTLVTGPSGAGRTTAIHVLEDLGYEGIDNIPLSLVPHLVDEIDAAARPLALGLDVRNRDFDAGALLELIDRLAGDSRLALDVLYLDCTPSELVRRFSETRRRHPLAPTGAPSTGIARELALLAPIRGRADHLIDTTELTPHMLREEISRWFSRGGTRDLAVTVQSFSYRRGLPAGADVVIDCRLLANPYWEPALRDLDGRAPAIIDWLQKAPRFRPFFDKVLDLLLFLLPAHKAEGKTHLAIAFGCTGGRHRSVAVTELMASALADAGWAVARHHRELERKEAAVAPAEDGVVRT